MNIGIIGLGLIGGSLGRSLIKNTSHTVYGYDISGETMLKAELLNAVHQRLTEEDYINLDILIIALNPRAFEKVLAETVKKLKDGAIVMDIAGNKHRIVEAMRRAAKRYPEIKFIATHPMAGREFWGINHSVAGLFEKASVLMIPVHTDIKQLVTVKRLLLDLGVLSVIMTNEIVHDKMIAYTSQLAHIVSSSYVKSPSAEAHNGFSAGSFRDLTRVAKLNAPMWAELMTDNRENLVKELDIFIKNLKEYRAALAEGDEERLLRLLEEGNLKKELIEKATREWKRNI